MSLQAFLVSYSVTVLIVSTVVGCALIGLLYAVIEAWSEGRRKK